MPRVLAVKRYSGDDDTGALQRQEETLDVWIRAEGLKLAAWVEDETVSGGVNLDERPALGKWLKPPLLDEWDILAVTEQDRITRDDLHWWGFVANLQKWGKSVRVLDDPGMDLSTPNGRILAGLKATQAANYRLDVKKKIKSARKDFRQNKRWPGGHWPYGHRGVPNPDGDGWILVEDQETAVLVNEAKERVFSGEPLRSIVRDWKTRGVLSGRDHQQATKLLKPGEKRSEPKGYKWSESSLTKILRSPSLIGQQKHDGQVILEDGIPVEFMPPIMSKADYDRLQAILTLRGDFRRGIKGTASDLLGVVFCPCGEPLHRLNTTQEGKKYEYLRCKTRATSEPCAFVRSIPVEDVKGYIEELFDGSLRNIEIMDRRYVPGTSHDGEIQQLNEAIDNLAGSLATMKPGSRTALATTQAMDRHEAKLEELEVQPRTAARWEYTGTGETYGRWWDTHPDWYERGRRLRNDGLRVVFGGTKKAPVVLYLLPGELQKRVNDSAAGQVETSFLLARDEYVKVAGEDSTFARHAPRN